MIDKPRVEEQWTTPEIEDMVSGLPEWEQEARRVVYRFMEGEWDIDINTLLNTKLASNADEWGDIDTIWEYYEVMAGQAINDREFGFNATFAIDFVRMVDNSMEQGLYG